MAPLDDDYRAILPNFRAITFARWLFYGFDLRRKQMEWKRDGVPPPPLVHHRLAQAYVETGALVEREGALEKNVARDRTLPLLRVGWRVPPHVPAIQEVVRLCRLRPYGDAWVSLFEVPLLPVPQVEPHCEPPVAQTS
jgi:hypothetical protein